MLCAIFLAAASAFVIYRMRSAPETGEEETIYEEWVDARLPLVHSAIGDHKVNMLHGYTGEVKAAALEDSLMIADAEGKLDLTVLCYGSSLEKITWEAYTRDMQTQILTGELGEWQEDHDTAQFTLDLGRVLTQVNREYRLVLRLATTAGEEIAYYTRVKKDGGLHAQEMLDYIYSFHAATFDKTAAREYAINLESDESADANTLAEVDIKSTFQQLTWGDLAAQQVGDVNCQVLEMDDTFGSFLLEYVVEAENASEEKDTYLCEEYFSIQWSTKRFYLMDYHRTMTEVVNGNNSRLVEGGLDLGITEPSRVSVLKDSENGRILFAEAGELWDYNIKEKKLTRVFSFREENSETRIDYRRYSIKALQTYENGDVSFLVYGYMNSGSHEGRLGVSCMTYHAEDNALSEAFFLPYGGTYETLAAGVEKLSRMSTGGDVFLMVGDTVYSIDWEGGEVVVLADHVSNRNLVVNSDMTAVAWKMDRKEGEAGSVEILYLDTGDTQIVGGNSGDLVTPLGFMEEDCVLGIAHEGESALAGAERVEPYYALTIRSRSGKEEAHYETDGVRLYHVNVEEGQVTMDRLQQQGDTWNVVDPDSLIRNSHPGTGKDETFAARLDDLKKRVYAIQTGGVAGGNLKVVRPDRAQFAAADSMELPAEETAEITYYAYARGHIAQVCATAGEAIAAVYDRMGAVTDSTGRLVWYRTGRQTQVSLAVANSTTDVAGSRRECLRQILAIARMDNSLLERVTDDMSSMDAMNTLFPGQAVNLTGAPLRALLLFLDRETPVLLMDEEQKAVLIVGYDQWNIKLFDPVQGKSYKMGQQDATDWLAGGKISAIGYLTE